MENGYTVGKTGSSIEFAGGDAKFWCQVHPGDAAPIFRGDPSGGAADAATNIQQVIARLKLHHCGKFPGRYNASAVEMIDGPKGIRSDRHVRPMDISECGKHAR